MKKGIIISLTAVSLLCATTAVIFAFLYSGVRGDIRGINEQNSILQKELERREADVLALNGELTIAKNTSNTELIESRAALETELAELKLSYETERQSLKTEIELLNAQLELQSAATAVEKTHPLDEAYNKEMNSIGGTTLEMMEINDKYAALWEAEMNKLYGLLESKLNGDTLSALETAQAAWVLYSEAEQTLETSINEQIFEGGSILNVIHSGIILEKYRTHTLELSSLYDLFSAI